MVGQMRPFRYMCETGDEILELRAEGACVVVCQPNAGWTSVCPHLVPLRPYGGDFL